MKKAELFFSFLLVPLDFIMFLLAGISAYYLRFSSLSTGIRPVFFDMKLGSFMAILLPISLAWVLVFALAGLYRMRSTQSLVKEFYSVVQASALGMVLIMASIFFSGELFNSRFIVLAGWLFAILYVTLARIFIRYLQRRSLTRGVGVHKIVLVGDGRSADILMTKFSADRTVGFEVVKRLEDFSLESAQELRLYLENKQIDEIIQADPNMSKAETLRLFDFTSEFHLTFKYVADLLDAKVLKTEVSEIAGLPVVEVIRTTLDGWGRVAKRMFDLIGASILIILTSPITITTAILIKLDSRGPVFFSKRDDGSLVYRVGQYGKLFPYYKFRSMRPGTDSMRYKELAHKDLRNDGPLVKIKDDPRVTRIGRFIRRWSIDELAELFLVFKGDMSLVGPRPHLPEEVAKYEQAHKKVLTIKPGITGLAQVSGRSDLSFEEEVKLDTYYIENWSLALDLSILLKTPLAVLRSRKTE